MSCDGGVLVFLLFPVLFRHLFLRESLERKGYNTRMVTLLIVDSVIIFLQTAMNRSQS